MPDQVWHDEARRGGGVGTLKLKNQLLIAGLVLASMVVVPWVVFNIFAWSMSCAFGVATDAEYAACRRIVDVHFGIRIIPAVLVWGLLLVAVVRTKRQSE